MADQFNWEAIINFGTQNADTAEKSLKFVQDLVVALGESGKISEKTMKSLFRSIETQSKRAAEGIRDASGAMSDFEKASTSASSKASKEFQALSDRVSDVSDQMRQAAQELAGAGMSPSIEATMSFAGISPEQLQEVQRYYDAVNTGAQDAARIFAQSENQKRQAAEQAHREIYASKERWAAQERQVELNSLRETIELRQQQARQNDSLWEAEESKSKQRHEQELSRLREQIQERARLDQIRATQNNALWEAEEAQAASNREAELGALKQAILARHTKETNSAIVAQINGLPRLRYAMYDVAQTTGVLTAAIGGLATGAITASAQYETAFTAVERTSGVTGDAVGKLRDDFLQLAREIPQTFAEISNIGARGAQLGIATDQLDDFTKVVAQFVATSDTVTLDQAVEAFGRISNLLGDTDFNRIGSAITLVGVNAAATEAQIVKTTQELAPFATAVGMSTEGVIALATALGSLGQPPERARSAFLNLQKVMDTAIASGSDNLQVFGKLLGVTADEVEELWRTDPDRFITSFSRALAPVEDLTSLFSELGIQNVRTRQVFQALAADARNAGGELSVLERAMQDSARGYAEGTELARQYGLIVDDLASKWQIFKNSVMELTATLGDTFSPILKGVLDLLSGLVQGLSNLAQNPAGRVLVGLVSVIGGVTFAIGTLITTVALSIASLAGFRTALDGVTRAAGTNILSVRALRGELAAMVASVQGGTTALRLFRGALAATGIGLAITATTSLIWGLSESFKSAKDHAEDFYGTLGDLSSAIRKDTAIYRETGEAFFTISSEASAANPELEEFERQMGYVNSVLGVTVEESDRVTESLDNQTQAWGRTTLEAVKAALANSEAFRELVSQDGFEEFWGLIGGNMDEFINISAHKGWKAGEEYVWNLIDGAEETLSGEDLEFLYDVISNKAVVEGLGNLAVASAEVKETQDLASASARILGLELEDAGDSAEYASGSMDNLIAGLLDSQAEMINTEKALFNLGSALLENEGEWGYYTEGGRANMEALMAVINALSVESAGDLNALASNLQALYDYLVSGAFASAEALEFLKSVISSLPVKGAIRPAARNFSSLFSGIQTGAERAARSMQRAGGAARDMGGAARQAREEVRTVLDYAKDLQGVFGRAFDLRFGVSIAQDNTANMLQKMRDEAEAARDRIRDLQSSLRDLRAELGLIEADISKTQYFLSIAIEYGDTRRAEQLQANLAKLEADRAKTQENLRKTQRDLNKEQEANSKSTQGNSQAARDNRKALQDLFQSYQAQIVAYAEAGASQEELDRKSRQLREEFVRQATQLGYNRRDVQQYEKAFNDLTIAIRNVPRNVSLEVKGLNPAVAALREFEAKVRKHMDAARKAASGGVSLGPIKYNNNPLAAQIEAVETRIAVLTSHMKSLIRVGNAAGALSVDRQLSAAQAELRRLVGYSSGGFTGRGGKYEPAGIVHKGEYVIPKHLVNQSTGLPYADALGRLVKGTPSPAGYARGGYVRQPQPGTQTVALTPGTIQAIAQATGKNIFLDGKLIADSSAESYSRDNSVGAY